jgi:prepilin-type N-terminal cleavage/methylation domain-containing protein
MESGDNKMKLYTKRSFGFTLIELLVVVAIIAVLIAILLPSLVNARQMAKLMTCAANMKTFGLAEGMYTQDNNGSIPPGLSERYSMWDGHLAGLGGTTPYILNVGMYQCPADTTEKCPVQGGRWTLAKRSYSANVWMHGDFVAHTNRGNQCWPPKRLSEIDSPSTTMSLVDSWNPYNTFSYGDVSCVFIPMHFDVDGHMNYSQANELYFDGSVKAVRYDLYILMPNKVTNSNDGLWVKHYCDGKILY